MSSSSPPDAAPTPDIHPGSRFNKVWIIPIVAVLLGIWLVKHNYENKGPLITIRFENADGLKANKTTLKCRNVTIGMVEAIQLTENLAVELMVRIDPQYLHLIREDSRFWVEKPRIEGASISGLNTIVSGAFLQLDPGIGQEGGREFIGLEDPPVTPRSVEGLRLTLTTDEPGPTGINTGIYYQENLIGRVESRVFDLEDRQLNFGIFIEERYRDLVTENSLFWRSSGISLEVGADGFDLDFPSLDALVAGRISVGVPKGLPPGGPRPNDSRLILHQNQETALNTTFQGGIEMLVLLDESLRGLKPGSPVEFRGLRVGRVEKISYKLLDEVEIQQIPVLIQLDDRLLATHFPPTILDEGDEGLQSAVASGLRASLKSSNLLTGQLYLDLDFFPKEPLPQIATHEGRLILPTIHTGLSDLQDQVAALLEKLNTLELNELVATLQMTTETARGTLAKMDEALTAEDGLLGSARTTLSGIESAVASLNEILASQNTKALPGDLRKTLAQVQESLQPLSQDGAVYGDLRRTLDELRGAIRSIDRMTSEIAEKPNSLLFGKDQNTRKKPRARR